MELGGRLHAAAVLPITKSIRYPQGACGKEQNDAPENWEPHNQ